MKLYVPSKEEAAALLAGPKEFHGMRVCEEALPPSSMLERAIAGEGSWRMPRLFCEDGNIVGSAAFKCAPTERRVEVGYGVAPACMGRGYATEGVKLMVEEAFSSGLIDEVFAETSLSNEASGRVLEKAGFTISGSGENDEGPVNLWTKKRPNQPGAVQPFVAPDVQQPAAAVSESAAGAQRPDLD